jgi:hypothetical protein
MRGSGDPGIVLGRRGGRDGSRGLKRRKRELGESQVGERRHGAALRDRARHRRDVHHEEGHQTRDDDGFAERRPAHGQQTEWIRWSY